jgi:hypothetical protein
LAYDEDPDLIKGKKKDLLGRLMITIYKEDMEGYDSKALN